MVILNNDKVMDELEKWISSILNNEWNIYVKRLSANDTGLTGGHQVGVYFPKQVLATVFPSIDTISEPNPEYQFYAKVVSHNLPEQELRAIYYNGKFHGKTRNEKRITRWNTGVAQSPLQYHENTGALVIFAFHQARHFENADELQVWVCENKIEEDFIEKEIGEILPGQSLFERSDSLFGGLALNLRSLSSSIKIPESWKTNFPKGRELIDHLDVGVKFKSKNADSLLLERRDAEFSLFRQVEELHVLDQIKLGFQSVDDFIRMANSVGNRRKSRSGRSLEIHLEKIFHHFGLTEFTAQCITEGNKRPDFIFPSAEAYHDPDFDALNLKMLAVKTTCKDRWRQILNEADRVGKMYLLTLQEGVSINQFNEMLAERVILVVPEPLHKKYPKELRPKLMSVSQFIEECKCIQ